MFPGRVRESVGQKVSDSCIIGTTRGGCDTVAAVNRSTYKIFPFPNVRIRSGDKTSGDKTRQYPAALRTRVSQCYSSLRPVCGGTSAHFLFYTCSIWKRRVARINSNLYFGRKTYLFILVTAHRLRAAIVRDGKRLFLISKPRHSYIVRM